MNDHYHWIWGFNEYFSLQTLATSNCSDLTGCEKKFCEVNKQLTIAQHNHDDKANRLEKALEQAKENGTNTRGR
ncbi:DUF1090 family protein [Shewanella surugensis]|uniref:DUF1090 family protein n=1 Tax=Shewanella surugensis TaxID=212020 RepID=UPI0035E11829